MRFAFAAVLFATAASPVLAADVHEFAANGTTFDYVAKRNANGSITLTGHDQRAGTPFALTVRGRTVRGEINYTPVDFTVPRETAERIAAEMSEPVMTASN